MTRRVSSSRLAQNTAALYGVHLAGLILPLVTFPYLARVLRAEGWGLVLFSQSFALWLSLVLEFGFYLSGTRMIAGARDDRDERGRIVAGVLGAKGLLLIVVLIAGLAAYLVIPEFRRQPVFLVTALLYAMSHGLNPFWYFQGVERVRTAAGFEVAMKALATAGIFAVVRSPSDGWLVLALQAGTGFAWVAIGTSWIYREVAFSVPTRREALAMMRASSPVFAFRGAAGVYTQAMPFLLGLLATAPVVAYYAAAERLIRGATGTIQPISQALYPRLSYLVKYERAEATRLLRASLLVLSGAGLLIGAVAFVSAPFIVPLLLGPGYEAAVPVLRALSAIPPVVAIGTVLGIQWALPMGFDRHLVAFVMVGGAISVLAAVVLVPPFGAMGMAAAVTLAEIAVVTGLIWLSRREGVRWWPNRALSWLPGIVASREAARVEARRS